MTEARPRWPARLAAVSAVALLTYWQAIQVGFLSDDHLLLVAARFRPNDLALLSVNPDAIFYRPLGLLAWKGLYALWQYQAAGYHLAAAGLHALNAVLVAALAREFSPTRPSLALSAGLLFAVLPFSIEAVVWLASLYDLLVTATYLLTLLVFIRAWRGRAVWPNLLGAGLYQLCLWSKEAAFSLPAVLVVVALLLPRRPRAAAVAASLALALVLLGVNAAQRWAVWGGLGGYPETTYALRGQLLLNLGSIAVKLVAPYNLALFGPVRLWATLLSMTALGVVGLWAARRRRPLLLSAAWLALTIAVFINVSGVGSDLQNTRYLYLPAAGFCLGLVEVLHGAARRLAGRVPPALEAKRMGWLGRAVVAALAGYYFVLVQAQVQPWITATRLTDSLAAQIHALTAGARPASLLQVVGLPDNVQGAYIFRNGTEAVQLNRYGSLFHWVRVGPGQPPTFPNPPWPADLYQFDLAYDAAARDYRVVGARGLSLATDEPLTLPSDYWLSSLPEEAWVTARAAMGARRPALVAQWSFAESPDGPALALSRDGWLVVGVGVNVPNGAAAGAVTLAAGEAVRQTLPLPRGPFAGRVHFFVPPGSLGEVVTSVRVGLEDGVGARITTVEVSALPALSTVGAFN